MSNSLETVKDVPPDLELCSDDSISVSSASFDQEDGGNNEAAAAAVVVANESSVSFSVKGLYSKYYPTEEEVETLGREFVCCRRRMRTRPINDSSSPSDLVSPSEESDDNEGEKKYETAMFVPEEGLVGTMFWHEYDSTAKVVREDRAILFQSQENYRHLIANDRFKSCFDDIDYMESPTFGEQVIVNGCETPDLAIGDVFEIEGGHSPLVVEITAPRKPCHYMNLKHGTKMGASGIQSYSHHNFLAGWFARVLVAGELREGMKFTRKRHPNPKWTMNYIYKALYGEGNRTESLMNASSWHRDRKELEELIGLSQLGEYEWKVEGRRRLLKMDGIDWKSVRRDSIDPQFDHEKWKLLQFEL